MAVLETFTQDPDAKLDYSIDWSAWLVDDDAIDTSTWAVDPLGPALSGASVNLAGTVTTIFVDGGTVGSSYILTNHIVTDAGREDDRSVKIRIAQR